MENHILAVKNLLMDKFKFLKRLSNNCAYSLSGDRNQRKVRNQISAYINWNKEQFLDSSLKKYHLKISRIELVNADNPSGLEINYSTKRENPASILTKMRVYKSKELCCVSDKSFQSFMNAGAKDCPSLRYCKSWRRTLNSEFKIVKNTMGSYVSAKEKIGYYLRYYKESLRFRNNHVNIRLAGDGTEVGSNFSVLNFTFGFIDQIKTTPQLNPNSVTGNFALGTFYIKKEDHNELKTALQELLDELKVLKTIEIDGIEYTIEFWLGGDLKFLALVLGKHRFKKATKKQMIIKFFYN
jgi:hypothetical protein